MYGRFYHLIGKTLAFIGIILVLFSLFSGILLYADANSPWNPPSMFISQQGILVMIGVFSFGLVLTSAGLFINKRYRKVTPYFVKNGGPIHSGETWTKSSESGVFLTSCGIVLSINQESNATSHIGYKIVTVERTTCRDCALREGRDILESVRYSRDGP